MTEARGHVAIEGVEVRFGAGRRSAVALAPTDLALRPGTFTALVGPSGCGKSTLLNAVGGFTAPTSGKVTIDGRKVTGPSPDVGVVFQAYGLFPWFTALGNVAFALKRLKLGRDELAERALRSLREVGLDRYARHYPAQLSGGMKQRVAIARTLAGEPKVLLMDEPFGALDAQTRFSMHELLLRVWDLHRATVLFVTHDVDEALLLADAVHVMSAGPGRVIRSYAVDVPRPRSAARFDAALVDIRAEILELLRPAAIANGQNPNP